MSIPLLVTKLHLPQSQRGLVTRSSLIKRLNNGLSGKVTLVSAPAGFGKTTLISDWVCNSLPEKFNKHAAWLSLDNTDNTTLQFWHYVISALKTVHPSLGKTCQAALYNSPTPPINAVLTNLINEIAKNDGFLFLGLDDYHEIINPEIHDALDFFIEHLPNNLHLAIITREDPPLALSRLRGPRADE